MAALLLAQAGLALEIDPYFLDPLGERPIPPLGAIHAASAVLGALALASAFAPGRWSSALTGSALLAGCCTALVSSPVNAAWFHAVQLLLLAAALLFWLVSLERSSRGARAATRLGLAVLVLLSIEFPFTFVARSHAVGYTLAARAWFSRYWQEPANSLGYRDVERHEDGRPHLLVLGDSFVAGVGIRDVRERFSDRLQVLVGERYQVHNLGWNGSDTRNEYERLTRCPFPPSVVVLSYYVNDISDAAGALGRKAPPFTPYRDVPPAAAEIIRRSYALDFLYWSFPKDDLARQGKFLASCYTQPEVVAQHQADLQRIVDWTRAQDCRLIAVLFPDLTRIEASAPRLEPVREVCAQNQVPVVEVRELVQGKPTAELVVNENDAHPSPWLHARVAEALRDVLEGIEGR